MRYFHSFALTQKLAVLITASLAAASVSGAPQEHQASHQFSIKDVQGGELYATFGQDPSVICGHPNSLYATCPSTSQPKVSKNGIILYPIESLFGYEVSDFVGAAQRTYDSNYLEGFAGDVTDVINGNGVAVSNVETNMFKTRDPFGTWCTGLGGKKVKCSTEHYVVMEHILSCNETVPYSSELGVQRDLIDPATGEVIDSCANHPLDDELFIVRDFEITDEQLVSTIPGEQMDPNESTVRKDIAVGRDYTITLKDDGKPLYRWGNAIKRPVDIRLYAQMPLPEQWKANPEVAYPITFAELSITHTITNNPNDQIRPEDMENEGATGRLPTYTELGDVWLSTHDCYEGDGDLIPAGTLFTNSAYAQGEAAFSSDLREGMTNAWYTSINRDPFEGVADVVGPRWRLKANKYGQDIPGLEIATAASECLVPPPYAQELQKYEVGSLTTTTIDLLDFESESPLSTSWGWIDASKNLINLGTDGQSDAPNGMSINGLPMTEDFDLAVYVKGDKKEVTLYNAELVIHWDDMQ